MQLYDPAKKVSMEELCLTTSLLRYCFRKVLNLLNLATNKKEEDDSVYYLTEVEMNIERAKKNQVKNILINLLERIIQPHYNDNGQSIVLQEVNS
jgi:hypothetical protein